MPSSALTYRLTRRRALLLMLMALAFPLSMGGLGVQPALADKGEGDGGGRDGGDDGGGSDDGGDDSGSDDGGNDDGDSNDGGGGGGSGSGSGRSSQSSASSSRSGAAPDSQQRDGALARRLKDRIAPVNEIETLAGKVKPGEVLDIKLYRESSTYVYRVEVIQPDGNIYVVKFDAVTRKLLGARQR